jgi:hypothetical protein
MSSHVPAIIRTEDERVLKLSEVESDLSRLTDHLMGEVLTLVDAVIANDRQCDKTKDTIRQFFANYREVKWRILSPFREVGQVEAK